MNIRIEGCPITNGQGPCHGCGGGWPGTEATSEQLTRALESGRLIPEKLGCGPLVEKATFAQIAFATSGDIFVAPIPLEAVLEPAISD